MIRERGEPAIADTSKPILEAPVFPDYPQNTPTTRPVAEDPDLVGGDEDEDIDEDLTDEADVDEFDDVDSEDPEVVIEDGDEIIDADDDEDDL